MLLWIILGLGLLTIITANFLGVDKEKAELFIEQYQFPNALKQKLQQNYPDLNDEEIDLVFEALRDFFQLHVIYSGMAFSMPSKIVDEAWHQMILFTKTYQAFCKQAFGRFLHHSPAVDKNPNENQE